MQETWVWSLGWADPWRMERLTTPVFLPGEFHGLYNPWGCKESETTEQFSLFSLNLPDFFSLFVCPVVQVPINLLCETRTTSLLQDLLKRTCARLSRSHQNSLSLYHLSVSKNWSSLLVSTAYITENCIYLHSVLDQVPQKQILKKYWSASNLLRMSFQGRLVSLTREKQQPNKSEISSKIWDRSCSARSHRELWTIGCASDLSSPGSTHESFIG